MTKSCALLGSLVGLVALVPALAFGQCAPDAHEPDDLCGQGAAWPELDVLRSFDFCDDPEDWFELGSCAGRRFRIEVVPLGARGTPTIAVVGEDCEVLLADDGDGDGRIDWTAIDDGRAFLRVREASGLSGDGTEYQLSVNVSEATPEHVVRLEEGASSSVVGASNDGLVVATRGPAGEWLSVTGLEPGGAPAWRTTWDSPCSNRGFGAPTDDGGLLALGEEIGGASDVGCVARVDAAGNLALGVELPGMEPWRVVDPGDGGLLVAGHVDSPFFEQDVGLVRLDASGAVLWQAALHVGSVDNVHGLVRAANGDFIIVVESLGSAAPRWVARLAADASALVWARGIDMPAGLDAHSPALFLDADPTGGVVLLGGCIVGGRPCDDPDLYLFGLDADGNATWRRRLDSGATDHPFRIDVLSDGEMYVSGGQAAGAELPDSYVLKADASGVPLWARELFPDEIVRAPVAGLADGGVAVATSTLGPAVLLTRLDPNGDMPAGCPSFAELPLAELALDPLVTFDADPELRPLDLAVNANTWTELRDTPAAQPACDCACQATAPPEEVSAPGSLTPLRVDKRDDAVVLSWEPRGESAYCRVDLHRGSLEGLPAGAPAPCLVADLARDQAMDDETPPPSGWYYLVRATGALGDGTPGHDSSGTERALESCSP